jgi:hypothetical protein
MTKHLDSLVSIHLGLVSERFGVAYEVVREYILKCGNVQGVQLLSHDDTGHSVSEQLFRDLEDTDAWFQSLVVNLDTVRRCARGDVPFDKEPRLYFLLDGGVIVYIGQTGNICSRIAQHLKGKVFDGVYTVPTSKEKSFIAEAVNILYHTPYYNKDVIRPEHYFNEVLKRSVTYPHGRVPGGYDRVLGR